MASIQLSLIKGEKARGAIYRDQLPVNMVAQVKKVFRAAGYMTQIVGINSFANGQGVDRGAIWVTRQGLEGHYRVSGNSFIKLNDDGTIDILGTVTGEDQASLAYSFNNIAIVANGALYYYNASDGFRQITDEQVGNPIDIVWIDNYFVLTDGENVYHSTLVDETQFNPLDFATAEYQPDPSFGLALNESDELMIFGQISTEVFSNTGGENFAFTRIKQKAQKVGIVATRAKVEYMGAWFALARHYETQPSFYVITIGSSQKIASQEIDRVLSGYSSDELKETTIDTYEIDGHSYIQFNTKRHTFVYNSTVAKSFGADSAWTIAQSGDNDLPWRGRNIIYDPSLAKWVTGDRYDGNIGLLDSSHPAQYGAAQVWEMATPFVNLESLSVDQISIETVPGIAPDNDATVAMSLTYDGRVYSSEWWAMYGHNLNYSQRFIINRLGYVSDWVGFRFRGHTRSKMSFAEFNIEAA